MSSYSTHLADRSVSLHLQSLEEIVPGPPASHSLAVDVHGNTEQRQEDRSATEDVHDLCRAMSSDPVIGKIRETVKHEILGRISDRCPTIGMSIVYNTYLEKHVHDEDLIALVSERVQAIRQRGENSNQHTDHHDALEEGAQLSRRADRHGVSEEEHPYSAGNACWYHENQAELGFAFVVN